MGLPGSSWFSEVSKRLTTAAHSCVSRWKNGHAVCKVELPFHAYQVSGKVAFDRQPGGDSHFLGCSSCTLSPVQRHSNLGKQVRRGSHSGLLQAVDRRQSKKQRCLLLLDSSTQVMHVLTCFPSLRSHHMKFNSPTKFRTLLFLGWKKTW